MKTRNAIYAQSGGVTSVINSTAAAVIETCAKSKKIGKVYAGKNGILGVLREDLIDTSKEAKSEIKKLIYTPGGAFGSCRYRLKDFKDQKREYKRLMEVFKKYNIGYFFYNGGGDSQDTTNKISEITSKLNIPISCIGIPKTVDNDLPYTDNSPGFGSVAKYIAVSTREAGLDVASMCETSTKVFILEVMGRHSGWIAAASGLSKERADDPPHLILFPEIPFSEKDMLIKVKQSVKKFGYCVLVVSEGIRKKNGNFISDSDRKDAFGHQQLGGVAPRIASIINNSLGFKYHWAVSDYLQRSARHIASKTDLKQAYALGKAAVDLALSGENAVMPIIIRKKTKKYDWDIGKIALSKVANIEKQLPKRFISKDGFSITSSCKKYLLPLIQGEAYPPYKNGIPDIARLKKTLVRKKLKKFNI
tara:strand:- start:299 stop:1555 length:1257 start_codon:yes stop_codon:yes gene_type:complete